MSAGPNLCEVLRLRREDSWRRLVNKLGYLADFRPFKEDRKHQKRRNLNNSIKFNNDTSSGHYWIPPRFLLLCLGDHSVPRLEDNIERKVRICFLLQQDSASNIKVYVVTQHFSIYPLTLCIMFTKYFPFSNFYFQQQASYIKGSGDG